jgi:hypothetical protein
MPHLFRLAGLPSLLERVLPEPQLIHLSELQQRDPPLWSVQLQLRWGNGRGRKAFLPNMPT